MNKRSKILLVSGSGGHSAQMQILLKSLNQNYQCELLLENSDILSRKQFCTPNQKVFLLPALRGKNELLPITLFRIAICSFFSIFVVLRAWPSAIVSVGPGFSIPVSIVARMFGKKVIHIESWSRVRSKSYTGRVMYKIASLFIVQWKELQEQYPGSIFVGRLDALLGSK